MHCLNVLVIVLMPGDLSFQPENLSPNILPYQDSSFGLLFPYFQDPPNWPPCNFSRVLICYAETQFRNCLCLAAQSCLTLCNPMDCSPPDPLSMGFSRQEYWSSLLCPPPRDIPNLGIKHRSPALQAGEPPGISLTLLRKARNLFLWNFIHFGTHQRKQICEAQKTLVCAPTPPLLQ